MKKRLHLSLIALVGSVILFVVTSLAWFAMSEFVNIDIFEGSVSSSELNYTLYQSDDGISYIEVTSIDFGLRVPGDTIYYRLIVANTENEDFNANVYLSGITDIMADGSPYTPGLSLTEVVSLVSEIDSVVVVNNTLDQLISGDLISLSTPFTILSNTQETIDFTLTIPGSVDNTYQNLGIEIDQIIIYFDNQ